MVFSSVFFVCTFLPVTIALYYLAPHRMRNGILLLASLFFYAWGEPVYLFLMLYSILFNYVIGIDIARKKAKGKKAGVSLFFGVLVNLLMLGFFKYYGFAAENIEAVTGWQLPQLSLPLPIGLSFYTFQSLSYLIDVYWGKAQCQKNILSFGLYISMFPQLVAGPIVQYADIDAQLKDREESMDKFGQGVQYFIWGLAKKVLLANNLGAVHEAVTALPSLSVLSAWVGALAYTFQIYYDFSGYSDMAIGLGKMFGFELKENFAYPYCARSITQFWRRWHISLGSWFREYVYIPLGGNRTGVLRHIFNLLIVWALTGLWHGARVRTLGQLELCSVGALLRSPSDCGKIPAQAKDREHSHSGNHVCHAACSCGVGVLFQPDPERGLRIPWDYVWSGGSQYYRRCRHVLPAHQPGAVLVFLDFFGACGFADFQRIYGASRQADAAFDCGSYGNFSDGGCLPDS